MLDRILIRCDNRAVAGLGHFKRCALLAQELRGCCNFIQLVLDEVPSDSFLGLDLDFTVLVHPFTSEVSDAQEVRVLAHLNKVNFVIIDNYRVGPEWVELVQSEGICIFAFDDLDKLYNANLRINYLPGAMPSRVGGKELLGPKYFVTNNKRSHRNPPDRPRSVIFHAGWTGAFAGAANIIQPLLAEVREFKLQVTWLISNEQSLNWLVGSGLFNPSDSKREWDNRRQMDWGAYDIVIGPASTSLYEVIMQGALPISFALSSTQNDAHSTWIKLGHTLHLVREDRRVPSLLRLTMRVAISYYATLLKELAKHSSVLDGLGVVRIVDYLKNYPSFPGDSETIECGSVVTTVQECDLTQADSFLRARNAEKVRALSTNNRQITWIEHIRWWLESETTKYAFLTRGVPTAFFWHRSKVLDGNKFLIGGWFPASSQPIFDTAVRLLDWQLKQCASDYDGHLWVATINPANRAVIALNKKFGFQEASPNTRKYLNDLFPGTPNNFIALERPARL